MRAGKRRASSGQADERKTAGREKKRYLPISPQLPVVFAQLYLMHFPHYLKSWNRLSLWPNYDDHHLVFNVFDKAKYENYFYYYQLTLAEISQEN